MWRVIFVIGATATNEIINISSVVACSFAVVATTTTIIIMNIIIIVTTITNVVGWINVGRLAVGRQICCIGWPIASAVVNVVIIT